MPGGMGGIGGGGGGGGPGGMGNIFSIGKANPATKASTSSVRFKDVAGCEEGKVCVHTMVFCSIVGTCHGYAVLA